MSILLPKQFISQLTRVARHFQQYNIGTRVTDSVQEEQFIASRGPLFTCSSTIKRALSVKHPLVIFLFYSTLPRPFCKIVMVPLSAHLLPVGNLLNRFSWHHYTVQGRWGVICSNSVTMEQQKGFKAPVAYIGEMDAKQYVLFPGS